MIMQSKPLIQIIIRFPSLCDFIFFFDGGGRLPRTRGLTHHYIYLHLLCIVIFVVKNEKRR